MKRFALLSLIALSPTASAQAVIIGVNTGYLVDSQEAYFAARIGGAFSENDSISHQGEFEIGYTQDSDAGIKADILPLMLNYRAEFKNQQGWTPYVGVGAGMARASLKAWFGSQDDWTFALQGFAGVGYKASANATLTLGVRYLWIDDVKLFGTAVEVGDDLAIEAGVSFKF